VSPKTPTSGKAVPTVRALPEVNGDLSVEAIIAAVPDSLATTGVLGSVSHSKSTTIAHEETYKLFCKEAAVIAALLAAHQALMALVGSLLASDYPTR